MKEDKITKSKAAPKGVKTYLIYIPDDLHWQLKEKAVKKRIRLHECLLDALKKYCLYD